MRIAAIFVSLTLISPVAWADLGTGFDREPAAMDPRKRLDDCVYAPALNDRMQACTDAINSGKLGPIDLSLAHNNRGIARGKLRQHDDALNDFEAALNYDPEYADAFHNRAVEFARVGQLDDAITDLTEAITLRPRSEFYRSRGVVFENLGEFAKAIEDYSQAARMDPNDSVSRNSMAWILATAGAEEIRRGGRAVEVAQEAVDLRDSPSHRDTLAAAYAEVGEFSNAIQTQEQAINMLRTQGAKDAIKAFEQRLSLYKQGRPYRQD